MTARKAALAASIDQLLTRGEVCSWLGISRATSYRHQGSYLPRPIQIAPGVFRFRRSEIEALLQHAAEDRGDRGPIQ